MKIPAILQIIMVLIITIFFTLKFILIIICASPNQEWNLLWLEEALCLWDQLCIRKRFEYLFEVVCVLLLRSIWTEFPSLWLKELGTLKM